MPQLTLSLADDGLPRWDSPPWSPLFSMYHRAWFTRLWMVQEVVLAKSVGVLFGGASLDWETLRSCAHVLLIVIRPGQLPPNQALMGAVEGLHLIGEFECCRFSPLIALLSSFHRPACSLEFDKVYSMLGLVPEEERLEIKVDYSLPLEEVYLNCSEMVTRTDTTLPLFNLACTRSNVLGLPDMFFYHAGWRTFMDRHALAVSPDSDNIHARGIAVDKVTGIIPSNWGVIVDAHSTKTFMDREAAALSLAQQTYNTPYAVPEMHWRTLIANRNQYAMVHDLDLSTDYQLMKESWACKAQSRPPPTMDAEPHFKVFSFGVGASGTCSGRTCFATRDGRVGLGPADMEGGDLVCVILSGLTPYILRRNEDGRTYRFIGECYVHDLMDAEALDMRDRWEGAC
ncbi:hypothetical protein B0O99DRAFT_688315 [Bisporella sp. PMI_857]|nr:hypothetical protein B0O99DRAFT_688315 [Bisporella sp. PMI_857]